MALDEHRRANLANWEDRVDVHVAYTDDHAEVLEHTVTHEWNHGLGETVTAVLEVELTLTSLVEHREVEWQALPWMVRGDDGRWRLPDRPDLFPLMYSLTAVAPA